MSTLWQDLRYGIRMLRKSPGFTAVAVVSLALGIGINTSIFSLVNAVLIRPLPSVTEPERLVWFSAPASYPNFEDYRAQAEVFDGMTAASGTDEFSLQTGGEPELVRGEFVTADYFSVLGVEAARGRTFVAEDEQTTTPVVVISDNLWRTRYGADPALVGREIHINGMAFKVVGIAPPDFIGTEVGLKRELWLPLAMHTQLHPSLSDEATGADRRAGMLQRRDTHWLNVVARLKKGVAREQAESAMMTIAARLNEAYRNRNRHEALMSVRLINFSGGIDPRDRADALPFAGLSMAVVALVLLIACANVASLLLARAALRQRETAVRQALGASRFRLVRQWLTESLLLSSLGGAAGLLLAMWTTDLIRYYASATPLAHLDLSLDKAVLAFTSGVSLATGILFGLAPALQVSRPDVTTALKGDGASGAGMTRARSRLRRAFVVAQVTLSVVLLIGAGLFLRSMRGAQSIDPGFRVDKGLTLPVDLGLMRYTKERGLNFYEELLARVSAQPGVESASVMQFVPLGFSFAQREIIREGATREDGALDAGYNAVGADYFKTMGITLLRGREFTAEDREQAPPVVVVNETLARRLWPNEEAIGKRVSLEGRAGTFAEVVGVARDGKYASLGEQARPFVYQPMLQSYSPRMTLVVRTKEDPRGVAGTVRNQLRALEPKLPVAEARTLAEQVALSLFPARVAAWLLGSFGLLALALAGVGIYGIVSYSVSQRTHEIGVRLALGAQGRDVLRMVVGEGLRVVGLGIAVGLALSLAATRLVASFLYGVSPTDFATFTVIPLLLAAVAFLASYIPARRAAKVDPMTALRYE
ncbi:MAG TPA: ABC transporter permease [Pyrinomonadaceae bacterium]|nr:ABC transporter permease [Pyrinomonadaceae bacterium]